jgi:hypothetical protein
MPTLTAQKIVDRAWIILQDIVSGTGVRWPSTEQLLWFNDGQREIVMNLPSAYVKMARPTTLPGTRQDLAGLGLNDGIQPIKVVRNILADGLTPGRAITVKPQLWLDEQKPNWHSDTAAPAVHYFFDPAEPKAFYLWPPASGTAKIEVIYSASPPEVTDLAAVMTLDDIYANALQYYLLFRSFAKNATYTKNPQLATQYYQLFLQSLGIKDARVKALDANQQMMADGAGVAGPGSN